MSAEGAKERVTSSEFDWFPYLDTKRNSVKNNVVPVRSI